MGPFAPSSPTPVATQLGLEIEAEYLAFRAVLPEMLIIIAALVALAIGASGVAAACLRAPARAQNPLRRKEAKDSREMGAVEIKLKYQLSEVSLKKLLIQEMSSW
jgi:hypothetical protein